MYNQLYEKKYKICLLITAASDWMEREARKVFGGDCLTYGKWIIQEGDGCKVIPFIVYIEKTYFLIFITMILLSWSCSSVISSQKPRTSMAEISSTPGLSSMDSSKCS